MCSLNQDFWNRRRIGFWSVLVLLVIIGFTMVRLEAGVTEVAPLDLELDGPGLNVDDPCFWVDPVDPAESLVFITTKDSGLVEVFNTVTGEFVTTIPGFGIPNNCAVEGDVLLTTDRSEGEVKVHSIPEFSLLGSFGQDMSEPEGIDVLDTPDGRQLVYVTDRTDASVHVYDLETWALERSFPTGFGGGIEPVLADDLHQRIFVCRGEKETRRGIGVFDPQGTLLFEFAAELFSSDAEGMAIYACGDGGYLVVADQRSSETDFEVFDRVTLEHLGTFHLQDGGGEFSNSTDGIDILQTPLPGWPNGMLAVCDGCGSNRPDEMDIVSWDRIASAMGLDLCPDGQAPDCVGVPCTERIIVTADSFVNGAQPDTNFGSADRLEIELDPPAVRETLFRVDVPDLTGFEVLQASLRLRVTDKSSARSDDGGTLFLTTGDWVEGEVTFNNRPAVVGEPIASAGVVESSQDVDFDLSGVVVGQGSYNFLLLSSSPNKALYHSREANLGQPALTLVLQGSEPEVTITSPGEDTSIAPGTPLTLTAVATDAHEGDLSDAIVWSSDLDGELGQGPSLSVSTLSVGVHSITAEAVNGSGTSGSASVNVLVNTKPTVTITGPVDGSRFDSGVPVLLTGTAGDQEDGDLTAAISWTSDLEGELGSGGSLSVAALRPASHTITASVTDASGEGASDQLTVIINNFPPTIEITAPAAGSTFQIGETVGLMGIATDAEDGDLSAAISWTSDRDGSLGRGSSITTSGLVTPGPHVLTAEVTDSGAKTARATIAVAVNAPPTVQITSPTVAAKVPGGAQLALEATALDAEDGNLSAAIDWASDRDGQLGTGNSLVVTLSEGTHAISAQVIDSDGAVGADHVAVAVTLAAPIVTITEPLDGSVIMEGDLLQLAATAADFTDGDLTAIVSWESNLQGPLGIGGSVDLSGLVPGDHIMSASASDSSLLTGRASVQVRVIPATMELGAEADAYVQGSLPEDNFGAETTLLVDASPERQAFLRFAVMGIAGTVIDQAILRLTVSGSRGSRSEQGGTLYGISDTSWDEGSITYANRPPADGPILGSRGAVAKEEIVEFDVTTAVGGDGLVAFTLLTTSSDGVKYKSREAASGGPTLVLSLRLDVPDGRPTVAVEAPVDGSTVVRETPVTFRATAIDDEDGDLSSAVLWSSDLTGPLGTGSPLTIPGLPSGQHVIRADVTDNDGLSAFAAITLAVSGPPDVTILSPPDGTVPEAGIPVTFTAVATDPEDGDLSDAIVWESDLQGELGIGANLVVSNLGFGTHVVTATVTDSSLLEAQASIEVRVTTGLMVLEPEADAYVEASSPAENFGVASTLQADARPVRQAFLRFGITGTGGALVDQAVLSLTVSDKRAANSAHGGTLHSISDTTWEEEAITYENRPSIDGQMLGSQGPVEKGDVAKFDVTPAVLGDGRLAFALVSTSSDAVKYLSREALSGRPTLVLTLRLQEIPNASPGVAITAPEDGSAVGLGAPVSLVATASDPEDGDLSALISWASDRDGLLGTGGNLSAELSSGAHTLTASVVDSGGAVGSASVHVNVEDRPPVVAILSPTQASVIEVGTPVLLSGTAVDGEDGDRSQDLEWASSLDGSLGLGSPLSVSTLSVGQHVITATASDSGGNIAVTSVNVEVIPMSRSFDAVADAFVVESVPDSRFGADTHLIVRGDGYEMQAFLRFHVSGVEGLAVVGAKVRLTVDAPASAGSADGGQIRSVSDVEWGELAVTYNTRPTVDGPVLDTAGAVNPGDVVEFDVTPVIDGDGDYSFAVLGTVDDAVVYKSRESMGGGPQLIVSFTSE